MELKSVVSAQYYDAFCPTITIVGDLYSDVLSGKATITQDEEGQVLQATDFRSAGTPAAEIPTNWNRNDAGLMTNDFFDRFKNRNRQNRCNRIDSSS
jgi:hypothetical protein